MGNRRDSALRGLLIPDARLGVDDLAPNDGTDTGSSYTEVGGRPGTSESSDPRSRVIAVVQGGLEREIEIEVMQAGDPGVDIQRTARVRWRFVGDSDGEWRGHVDPTFASVWMPVEWNDNAGSALNGGYDAIVDNQGSERILVVHRYDFPFAESRAKRSVGIDHFEEAGVVADFVGSVPTTGGDDMCVTQLPSGRVIAMDSNRIYFSDDCFTAPAPTWLSYSDQPFADLIGGSGGSVPIGWVSSTARMMADRDGNVLMFQRDDFNPPGNADGTIRVLVSTNLGANFEETEFVELGGGLPSFAHPVLFPDGRIVVFYLEVLRPKCRILGSVFDRLADAPVIEIDPNALVLGFDLAGWVDPRGFLWCTFGTASGQSLYRSTDGGETWEEERWGWWRNIGFGPDYGPTGIVCVHARGFDWAIHGAPTGTSGYGGDNSIGCFRLGGWSNIEPATENPAPIDRRGQHMTGWNEHRDLVDPADSQCWHAFQTPDTGPSDWAAFGATAGAIVDLANGGGMLLTLATTDGGYEHDLPDETPVTFYGQTIPRATGGSGSQTALQHGIEVITTDAAGTTSTHVEIRIFSNANGVGLRVRDVQGAADLFDLLPSAAFVPQWAADGDPWLELWGEVRQVGPGTPVMDLWYRRSDSELWQVALAGEILGSGATPAGGAFIRLGATDAGGTVEQLWRAFYFLESDDQDPRRWDAGVFEPLGGQVSDLPIALVGAGELDVSEAFLSFRGGPASRTDVHTVAPIHDFPAAAVMWDAEPSRAVRWRDTDPSSIAHLTWMFPEATRLDGSWVLGLVVLDANFAAANLEVDLVGGGAGWTQVAALRLFRDLRDLHYERNGDILHPGTLEAATNDANRFINRGELVGGVARWASGASPGVARIVANGGGGWADKSVNTIHPYVRVDPAAVAGTSTASDNSGANGLTLQAPSGLVVAYLDAGQFIHGIRVVIPPAETPEGYREAGLIMPCAFSAFGQQWSRGYSSDTRPNVIRDESRQGTIRKREEGPPATRISMAWPDGVKLDAMRQGIDVNFLGPAGKPAIVADSDVWGQLRGILEETRSGEIPVVYVAELPPMIGGGPTSETLTDRSLWGFGTLDGSARFDHVLGDEGVNEYGRIAGIQIAEIR